MIGGMPGEPGPRLRAGRPGARPVRDIAPVGDVVGAAGAARTEPPQVSPALAGFGAARPGSPWPVAAARAFAAQRMDPGLSQPRPRRARHGHRRSARGSARDTARTGRQRGGTFTDPAFRGAGARDGLAVAGRPGGDPRRAGGPARAVLAAAD